MMLMDDIFFCCLRKRGCIRVNAKDLGIGFMNESKMYVIVYSREMNESKVRTVHVSENLFAEENCCSSSIFVEELSRDQIINTRIVAV
jgi:hypothetical protein